MLHPPPEQVRRCGSQRPRHEENAKRCRAGPSDPCGPVTEKRHGNEHRPWGDIAESDRRRKILGTEPAGLPDRNTLDERQGSLPAPEGEQADEHAACEEIKYHGVSPWVAC